MAIILSKKNELRRMENQYNKCTKWHHDISAIPDGPDTLMKLFNAHVEMWNDGVRNANIGPLDYGMFRTADISRMHPSEVFLGGKNGYFTHDIEFLEKEKDKAMERQRREGKSPELPDFYVAACCQYRRHLLSNVEDIRNNVFDKGVDRDVLAENIAKACNAIAALEGREGTVSNVQLTCASVADNRIMGCKFNKYDWRSGNYPEISSVVKADLKVFIPEGFDMGVEVTSKNMSKMRFYDVYEVLNKQLSGIDEKPRLYTVSELGFKRLPAATKLTEDMSRKELRENRENQFIKQKKSYSFGI